MVTMHTCNMSRMCAFSYVCVPNVWSVDVWIQKCKKSYWKSDCTYMLLILLMRSHVFIGGHYSSRRCCWSHHLLLIACAIHLNAWEWYALEKYVSKIFSTIIDGSVGLPAMPCHNSVTWRYPLAFSFDINQIPWVHGHSRSSQNTIHQRVFEK